MKPEYDKPDRRAKSFRRVVDFKEKIHFSILDPYASLLLLFHVRQRFCISYGGKIWNIVVFKFRLLYVDCFPCLRFFHLSIFIDRCRNLYFLVAQAKFFEILYNLSSYSHCLRNFFQMLPSGSNGLLRNHARISCLYPESTWLVQIPLEYLAVLKNYLLSNSSGVLA